jgi:hypothetical protein
MSASPATLSPPSAALLLMEGRALSEYSAFWLMRPWLSVTARGDGHPVLVLPGLLADDTSTQALRGFTSFSSPEGNPSDCPTLSLATFVLGRVRASSGPIPSGLRNWES